MNQPLPPPDQQPLDAAAADLIAVRTEEPCFLGADYVCTELPTYVTPARTKEQQALLDKAYEGWVKSA